MEEKSRLPAAGRGEVEGSKAVVLGDKEGRDDGERCAERKNVGLFLIGTQDAKGESGEPRTLFGARRRRTRKAL